MLLFLRHSQMDRENWGKEGAINIALSETTYVKRL